MNYIKMFQTNKKTFIIGIIAIIILLNTDLIHFSNDTPIDLEKYDFILSTQTFLNQINSIYYYEKIIDTNDALLDEYDQITWAVRAPDSDEDHVFYLGDIDIVYLQ